MSKRKPLPPEGIPPLLDPDEVATLLRTRRETVIQRIERGDICAIDFGTKARHAYRIPSRQLLDDLDRMAQEEAEMRRHTSRADLRSVK